MVDDLLPDAGEVDRNRASLWQEWPAWTILAGLWGFSLWALPRLPERVPTHWGWHGEVNGWGSPWEAAVLLPGLLTGLYGVMLLFFNARFDFRAARAMDPAVARRVRLLVVCLMAGFQGFVLGNVLRGRAIPGSVPMAWLAVFFIVFGNLMPRLEPNAWAGIRIPPTLEDREVWKRTHRLAGRLFVGGGILQLLACLLPATLAEPVALGLLAPMALIPIVYAYRIRS